MTMNDFLIFGASGLTGSNFLELIKEEDRTYHLFVRDFIGTEEEKYQTIFSQDNIPELPDSRNLVICLGYPLDFKELLYMKEKTKESFKEVDFDLVVEIAKMAREKDIPNIAIVSAVGSNINSYNFYLKLKAKMESKILSMSFSRTFFAKPGHLLGPRESGRVDNWVRLIEFLGKFFAIFLIGPLRKYRNIAANKVAFELLYMIEAKDPESNHLIECYERD